MGRETFDSELARLFIDRMLTALKNKPMVRTEMQAELFASKTKMLNYIRHLHGDTGGKKRIYVISYDDMPTGGRNPRYAVGDNPDAEPRGARSMSERWVIIKGDPVKHAAYKARLRAGARKRGIPPKKPAKSKIASPFAALGV
jgi:hypothetical protein